MSDMFVDEFADKFADKCGVFGVHGHADAIALTVRGLCALQHRGQESAGVAAPHGADIECVKVMGTCRDLIGRIGARRATVAVGHVRYATSGESSIEYAQPFIATGAGGALALCHNGHVVDLDRLDLDRLDIDRLDVDRLSVDRLDVNRLDVDRLDVTRLDVDRLGATRGAARESLPMNDSAVLTRRVADRFTGDLATAMRDAFRDVSPAYSVLVLTNDSVGAVRDPLGMRPLSVGRLDGATVFGSETCALDAIGATYVRDVEPGEVLVARSRGLTSLRCAQVSTPAAAAAAHCMFELIYFARPDSVVCGLSVAQFRMRLGERLALEAPAPGDVVVPVPDSAVHGGVGYARASGVDIAMGLQRSHGVGRSFIEPTSSGRSAAVLAKLHPIPSLIRGKRVVLVDDSIVRGTTCRHLVRMLRHAGATEVHVRVTSPPVIAACHFGIDTPDDEELFAARQTLSEMTGRLGVDSLEFLSLDGLHAVAAPARGFCVGCFSGVYPIDVRGGSALSERLRA